MSLKFLAVGKSLAGIRGDKSPYELRKENQLPTFGSSPRFNAKQLDEKAMVQTDFLQEGGSGDSIAVDGPVEPLSQQTFAPAPVNPPARAKRRWFSWLSLKWFRAQPSRADLVQSELRLDRVRVKRNDLADSDLQLVLKKRKKTKPVFSPSQENNGLAKQGWSELTARLFEIGQK